MPAFFNFVKNGYNPDEVDKYIYNLENILKSYKEKDEAISSAIVNAQIAADNIIKNSELAAKDIRKTAINQMDVISDSIDKQRQIIVQFQREYTEFVDKYIRQINEEEFKDMIKKVDELDMYFQNLKQSKRVAKETLDEPEPANQDINSHINND